MRSHELTKLIDGTADPAFVVDGQGLVAAMNPAAQQFLGVSIEHALGHACASIIRGTDESGPVCTPQCVVRQAVLRGHPLRSFELEIASACGPQWCNVTVLSVESPGSPDPWAVHILRPADVATRLQMALRDFVVSKTGVSTEHAAELLSTRLAASATELSARELEILRGLAQGGSTRSIAHHLYISISTVNNHIQHILRKLDAHSRLEAVRRAEHSRLI